MKRLEIQTGARFGKLTVVEETRLRFGSRPHVARAFVCRCDIDNDKGYSPDNCRWVALKEQGRNKRNNRMSTLFGETHPMPYWCERFNTYPQLVMQRLKRGWSVEAAFTEEVQ